MAGWEMVTVGGGAQEGGGGLDSGMKYPGGCV